MLYHVLEQLDQLLCPEWDFALVLRVEQSPPQCNPADVDATLRFLASLQSGESEFVLLVSFELGWDFRAHNRVLV